MVTRGCPQHCAFCYKDAFFAGGRSFYASRVDEALAEIERLPGRHLYFLDDHLLGDRRFAEDLFERMRGMGRLFQGAATIDPVSQIYPAKNGPIAMDSRYTDSYHYRLTSPKGYGASTRGVSMAEQATAGSIPDGGLFLIELQGGDHARYAVADQFLLIDTGQGAMGMAWSELAALFERTRPLRAVPLPGRRVGASGAKGGVSTNAGVSTEPGVSTNVEVNLVKIGKG